MWYPSRRPEKTNEQLQSLAGLNITRSMRSEGQTIYNNSSKLTELAKLRRNLNHRSIVEDDTLQPNNTPRHIPHTHSQLDQKRQSPPYCIHGTDEHSNQYLLHTHFELRSSGPILSHLEYVVESCSFHSRSLISEESDLRYISQAAS